MKHGLVVAGVPVQWGCQPAGAISDRQFRFSRKQLDFQVREPISRVAANDPDSRDPGLSFRNPPKPGLSD